MRYDLDSAAPARPGETPAAQAEKNPHRGHRSRMLEQFRAEGLEHMTDVECLEMLLYFVIPRRDTNLLAHALLEQFGSLSAVLDARVEELQTVPGMGLQAATLFRFVPEMSRRYHLDRKKFDVILNTTERCGNFLLHYFSGAREEMVYLLCLDAKCKPLECRRVSLGSVNAAEVSIRKIVEAALASNATGVVLAHNHTSGIALPSKQDRQTTDLLYPALAAMGIALADHIVVADDDYVSFRDSGYFDKFEQKEDEGASEDDPSPVW